MIVEEVWQDARERLENLLAQDLSFTNGDKGPLVHSLHAFAAKFPPQLPRHFIEGLSSPGDTFLDPMSGSGTAIVEAALLSRHSIGVDLDPLALRICKAKMTPVNPETLEQSGQCAVETAQLWMQMGDPLGEFEQRLDVSTREFINYWFTPETQQELAALALSIQQEADLSLRRLLEVVFSSVIVTKSGGVSLARDLAHSRPHRVSDKSPRSAIKMFRTNLTNAVRAFAQMQERYWTRSLVVPGDCRRLPLADASVDLIVTSPPYANALDYVRAHKFSLVWLGHSIKRLGAFRSEYIGAERWRAVEGAVMPEVVRHSIAELADRDTHKARVLDKYFKDMSLAINEMRRVLKAGRAAIIVVGPSTMRGLVIRTQEHLASIAERIGFEVVGVKKRSLDRDRRMMPARLNNNGHSGIELRIHEEYVIGLIKPAAG